MAKQQRDQLVGKPYKEVVEILGGEGKVCEAKGYEWSGAANTFAQAWFINGKLVFINVYTRMHDPETQD